jgi:hypothetical protein
LCLTLNPYLRQRLKSAFERLHFVRFFGTQKMTHEIIIASTSSNVLAALAVLALLFIGVGLKVICGKDEEVQGSCSARNKFTQDESCGICGKADAASGCGKKSDSEKNNS